LFLASQTGAEDAGDLLYLDSWNDHVDFRIVGQVHIALQPYSASLDSAF
jgi:hypothetical protein